MKDWDQNKNSEEAEPIQEVKNITNTHKYYETHR